MKPEDKATLNAIRHDLLDEAGLLSGKVRMLGRDDRLKILSMKATIMKRRQQASNIERIIAI